MTITEYFGIFPPVVLNMSGRISLSAAPGRFDAESTTRSHRSLGMALSLRFDFRPCTGNKHQAKRRFEAEQSSYTAFL